MNFVMMVKPKILVATAADEIARFVFDVTHETTLGIPSNDDIQLIRQEFGALEAPGLPEDNSDPEAYEDKLWARLRSTVEEKSK